eukprot:TRINITY_DN4399_c0_g1_i1.p1 TRINITY_DN4399_c0_g1~~TRINITY_DN4399_c0_g1_i1.p1  ORF type:complete len:113 (-),score=8.31 TRINITY_DN4399_c0_g1_i1:222-560(-)
MMQIKMLKEQKDAERAQQARSRPRAAVIPLQGGNPLTDPHVGPTFFFPDLNLWAAFKVWNGAFGPLRCFIYPISLPFPFLPQGPPPCCLVANRCVFCGIMSGTPARGFRGTL